jgi:NADP-dependent 3-hydroxy acid dehydrogenase YdfG
VRTLENKCAVVFGAGGSIGAAVAREFAAEGARVFLAGRRKASLEAVAEQIAAAGGKAETTVVDDSATRKTRRCDSLPCLGTSRERTAASLKN